MTLRADLATLLADAGIHGADLEAAVEDEHVRAHLYREIISKVAASQCRDGDRAVVATILHDPVESVSKTAVVQLVDDIAMRMADPAEFQRWATELAPEIRLLKAAGNRDFLDRRINDWAIYLAIRTGRTPRPAELAGTTDWMQRVIAGESVSLPILTLLAEIGRTRKIRNIARDRAGSRAIRAGTGSAP